MGATDRMRLYLENKGISKYAFHKKTGLSNKFLDNSSNMGTDKAEIILRYFPDINPIWLITGQGEMLNKEYNKPYQQNPESVESEPEIYYGSKKEKEYISIPLNEWEVMNNKIDNQYQTISDQKEIIAELKNIINVLKDELNIVRGQNRDKQHNKTA